MGLLGAALPVGSWKVGEARFPVGSGALMDPMAAYV
jgi:hypothetical protein